MSLLTRTAKTKELPPLTAPVLPRVNLLPPEIGEQARLRRVQLGLGTGLLLVGSAVGAVYVSAVGSVSQATTAVQAADAQAAALQTQTARYADVQGVYDQAAAAQAVLADAMGQEVRFSSFLHELSRTVPDEVWLTQVSFTQADASAPDAAATPAGGIGTVSFAGVGFGHEDVAEWLESVAGQRGYGEATFSNATVGLIGDRRTVSFTSTATLTEDALSGRYAAEGS